MDVEEGSSSCSSTMTNDELPKKRIKLMDSVCDDTEDINISRLPHNALVNIFKYLDFKTISNCSTMCNSFYKASNDILLYKNITLKYTMSKEHIEAYFSKISSPKSLYIEYKFYDKRQQTEDYTEFNKHVTFALKEFGKSLASIHFESCRSGEILQLLSECTNLKRANFCRCKATFESLPKICTLTDIYFLCSDIPNFILKKTLKNNPNLKTIILLDNINIYENGIAEIIGQYNRNIEEIHFCEKRRVRAKGMRAIARCNKLKVLKLTGGPYQCDPEDSLQQMAAGCPLLERLSIYGWNGINDDNLLPVLQCCTQLKILDLRGLDISIKSCREAALSLPLLRQLDVYKCSRIKKAQFLKLQQDFQEIEFAIS